MKVTLLYTFMCKPSESGTAEDYAPIHKRFFESYEKFSQSCGHKLYVGCYNGEPWKQDGQYMRIWRKLGASAIPIYSSGFDVGCYQAACGVLDCDLLICCNTQIHFHRAGWMERLVAAFEKHGPGAYAPMASYENNPHLRTPCIAFPPSLMREYPFVVNNRKTAHEFESGPNNFSKWVQAKKLPCKLVTWDDELDQRFWRTPGNIFRRGNQENILLQDRHSKLWSELPGNDPLKGVLSRSADGRKG